MGVEGVLDKLEAPKEFNRQMGPLFEKWLKKKYKFIKDPGKFEKEDSKPVFLETSGETLRNYANQKGCGLDKRPDFVARSGGKLIIGEAKFLGTEGGNQNRAFEDALNLASKSFKNAVTVAVLDGIVWIPDSGQMSRCLENFSGYAFTALLLDDFFQYFEKSKKGQV